MALAALRAITDIAELGGTQRAAVLVMYLDPNVARMLLNQLSNTELREIGRSMAEIDNVESLVIEQVVSEFIRELSRVAIVPKTGKSFALEVLPELIEEHRRETVVSPLRRELSTEFREYIAGKPARTVATVLSDEHAQTTAVALLLMGPDTAARVMAELDEQERFEVSLRMAKVQHIPVDLADEVERLLRQTLDMEAAERWQVAGLDTAAQILGRLGRPIQEPLLGRIAAQDRELSEIIRRRMVRFEDLKSLDDRSIQALLKSIDRQTLIVALKGAEPGLRELFLKNMSQRASSDLREELDLMGAMPRSQSRQAGEQIVQIAIKLQEEGVVKLYTGDQDEMV
jgi:flagellar motor switch protein FliG